MPTADEYRVMAADLNARALQESDVFSQAEYKRLAMSYLLLADQADKNAATDIVYETPVAPLQPQQQQAQQQQPQPKKVS